EVGVGRHLLGDVEHDRRRDERAHRDLRDVVEVLAGDPVVRGVEVGAGVLTGAEVVPVPGRAAVVVAADLLQVELRGLAELRRQRQLRGLGAQRAGAVDDVDGPGGQGGGELGQDGPGTSFTRDAAPHGDTGSLRADAAAEYHR